MNTKRILELLNKYEIRAKKKYGQNFLVDEKVIDKIVSTVNEGEYVIEIGPGLGSLTEELLKRAGKLTAYEIDEELVEILKEEYPDEKLELVNRDFLQVEMPEEKAILVSNLPYYITGDILLKCFREKDSLKSMTVMMQKEAADRFFNGKYEYGVLNVLADWYSEYHVVCKVDRHCFIPAPNVDSTVLEFVFNDRKADEGFISFLNACFAQRRKLLAGNLKKAGYVLKRDLGKARIEELSAEQLHELYEEIR